MKWLMLACSVAGLYFSGFALLAFVRGLLRKVTAYSVFWTSYSFVVFSLNLVYFVHWARS